MQDGFVWVRHAITELELPELTRSVSIFSSVFYPNLRWAFCQQNGKGKGYLLAVMDWESRTLHLRRMDMEHTGGEVQITAMQIVLERFQRHIEPQVNSYLARYTFHQCRQAADESVDEFIARCRVIAAKCKFTDLMETNIRLTEQLIVGTKHVEVQEKLLEKGDALASLEAAMDIARTFEATKAHVAQLQATGPLQVHAVASKRTSSSRPPCSRCGTSHGSKWEACPAHRQKCHACGRRGHYAQFCRTGSSPTSASSRTNAARRPKSYGRKNGTSAERNVSSVDAVAEDFATLTFEVVEISDISTENIITAQVQFNLDDGRVANLRGKVDTGAQGNLLPIRLFRQMFPERRSRQNRSSTGWHAEAIIRRSQSVWWNEHTSPWRVRH